jgi:MoxR-like ATPase
MAENQITIGDTTYPLEKLFFTIATQNPIEMEGTYPLPAAQLDRFFIKIYFGYVDEETELEIYRDYLGIQNNLNTISQVLSLNDVIFLQEQTEKVFIHDELVKAVRNIVRETRKHPDISLGASTRSGITFLKCLKAFAIVNGRSFVTEDDLQITQAVMDHRLIYRNKEAKAKALGQILAKEMDRLRKLNFSVNSKV